MSTKNARSASSGAQFTFLGIITVVADVLPVTRSDGKIETKLVSPDLPIPTLLKQQYVVEGRDDIAPVTSATCARAIYLEDKTLQFVTDEEITALKTATLPEGECSFNIFPASEVNEVTIPDGNAYRLRPTKMVVGSKAQGAYAMLVDLVADLGQREVPLMFVGEITIKGSQRMMRCESRDGNLVLVQLSRPGEMYAAISVPLEYDVRNLDLAAQLVDLQIEKFDPAEFASDIRARAEKFKASLAEDGDREIPQVIVVEPLDDGVDLLAALTASVAAATPKPARKRKKTPAAA